MPQDPLSSLMASLYHIGAIQFGEFTLKSGKTSSIYINLRKIISYPEILRSIVAAMWDKVHDCDFDLICGVPYTALPIATCMSLDHDIPMVLKRKEKKDYGTKQSVEGEFKAGQSCLIIEDVVTTGGSILETAQELEQSGLIIKDVISLIDREEGGKEALNAKYQFHSILTITQLLNTLKSSTLLSSTERHLIDQYFEDEKLHE